MQTDKQILEEVLSVTMLRAVLRQAAFSDHFPTVSELAQHPLVGALQSLPAHFFVYVFDMRTQQFVFVDKRCQEILGMTETELKQSGLEAIYARLTPQDGAVITNAVMRRMQIVQARRDINLLTVKFNSIHKFLKAPNNTITLYHQDLPLYLDDQGNMVYSMGIDSELPFMPIGKLPQCSLSFQDIAGRYHCIDLGEEEKINGKRVTRRELEVLRLMAQGYNSNRIAQEINLSIHTVNKHRQNLLYKTDCKNTAELIEFGIRMGWL